MTSTKLFSEFSLGHFKVRNRIAMPAMHLGLAKDGAPSDVELQFYGHRAMAGVGIITVGLCNTWCDESSQLTGALELATDEHIAPMARLADCIKEGGAIAAVQLSPLCGYNNPAWVPPTKQLPEILSSIGEAAQRAKLAGYHYVELMLSGGSLLSHFLSPHHNTWNIPQFSNGLEERLRAPLEAMDAIKNHAGADFPFTVRIHGHEFLENGYGLEEAAQIAVAFERAGAMAINVTGAGHRTSVPQITSQTPAGAFTFLAKNIVEAVSIPVFTGGRLRTPAEAQTALAESGASFVNLGRALIADGDWTQKASAQLEKEIVTCMACCCCLDQAFTGKPVYCSLNPTVGKDRVGDASKPASVQKHVVVAGSGPAGMQAAISASALGHRVTLIERANVLGGRWAKIAELKGREDLKASLRGVVERLRNSPVNIQVNLPFTEALAKSMGPDAIVIAVGPKPRHVNIAGLETHAHVLHAEDVLTDSEQVTGDVAIIGGNGAGVELAIHLARKGLPHLDVLGFLGAYGSEKWLAETTQFRPQQQITILKRRGFIGKGLGRAVRWTMMQELKKFNVRIVDRTTYEKVTPEGIHILNGRTKESELVKADTIVCATGYEPDRAFPVAFEQLANTVVVVGDSNEVSNIGTAIRQSHQAILDALG